MEEAEEVEEMEELEDDDGFPGLRAAAAGKGAKGPRLPTEDAFFKLEEMERFVAEAEEAAAAGSDGGGEEDEEEAEADFFAAERPGGGAGSDDDLDAVVAFSAALAGKKKGAAASAKGRRPGTRVEELRGDQIMYEDFFGPRPTKRPRDDGWGNEYRAADEGAEPGAEAEEAEEAEEADEAEEGEEMDEGEEGEEGEERYIEPEDGTGPLSAHARRAAKLGSQMEALEAANLGAKPWHMRGEARGGDRPLNSALELALDFEHAQLPAPVVTAEAARSLEALIRARCAENRFDDVERRLPDAPPRARRSAAPLSDEKSTKSLAQLYEEDFLKEKAAANAAAALAAAAEAGVTAREAAAAAEQPEDAPLVREARAVFVALCAKLDALSHFAFAPKPFVPDLEVAKAGMPALTLEELAPAAVSTAELRAPREVYAGGVGAGKAAGSARGSAAGTVKADEELTREEKAARRARKKRKGMGAAKEKEERMAAVGRKRAAQDAAAVAAGFALKEAPAARLAPRGERSAFGKSSQVFGALQEAKEAEAAGGMTAAKRLKERTKAAMGGGFKAAALKL